MEAKYYLLMLDAEEGCRGRYFEDILVFFSVYQMTAASYTNVLIGSPIMKPCGGPYLFL